MMMKKNILAILVLVIVGLSAAAFFLYREVATLKADPNAVVQEEIDYLVARVGKLILLPEGEVPTIATVTDPEQLRDQAFFAKAKVGDKILLYLNARKAYLYDPTSHKILEVAPINTSTETTVSPPVSVEELPPVEEPEPIEDETEI